MNKRKIGLKKFMIEEKTNVKGMQIAKNNQLENLSNLKRVGIVTSGGDAPGINTVISTIVKICENNNVKCYGFLDGFIGIYENRYIELDLKSNVNDISKLGGTILGSSSTGNLFHYYLGEDENNKKIYKDVTNIAINNLKKLKIDAIFTIGGDGTLKFSRDFSKLGIKVIGIPKTIDNDVLCTERTFGFNSAVQEVTECVDILKNTANSHSRTMIVEVMGRYTGWIALYSGIATEADVVLLPEVPYYIDIVAKRVLENKEKGKRSSIIIIAEGAYEKDGKVLIKKEKLGGNAEVLAKKLEEKTKIETRSMQISYLQRGVNPTAEDRILATKFAIEAVKLAFLGKFSRMPIMKNGKIGNVLLEEAVGSNIRMGARSNKENMKFIENDDFLFENAEIMNISFGR